MRIGFKHIVTTALAAGAAAVAISAAPTAMAAAPAMGACTMIGGEPVCPDTHSTLNSQAPSDNQINASPGGVDYGPQYPYYAGDYYGGYGGFGGFGGFGGGGHGGFGGGGHGR